MQNLQNDRSYEVTWTPEIMLEITLPDPESFLKIRETLTRIGIASKTEDILYPSCHILHKRGRYFILHFKEMFALEGKPSSLSYDDLARRNTIAQLLEQWGLCHIIDKSGLSYANVANIKIIPFKEKKLWVIKPKFRMMSDRKYPAVK